jgi:RNA polymerase sigma factor (sigma-70 family)
MEQINFTDNMTDIEKNILVQQYEPLINKITKQYSDKVKASWEDLKSMAYEGFAIAINTYDSTRSSMTFAQFAGFAIRNNILTSLNNELRTVKLSAYAQKKAIEKGNAVFNSVSIEANWDSDSERTGVPKQKDMLNIRQEEKFSDGDVFETLYSKLEENLPMRDCEIFYRTFGLKDFEEEKGKDIAVYFGISRALVSIKLRSVIQFIQKDEELVEVLSNLLK